MPTETPETRELIAEVTRQVITEVAPEELDLFDALLDDYFKDPKARAAPAAQKDDALGFGLAEMLVTATPIVAAAAGAVLSYLATEVMKTAQEEAAAVLRKRVKALFGGAAPAAGPAVEKPVPLTKDQLEKVQQLAIEQAESFGMDRAQALKMATALVGTLVLA